VKAGTELTSARIFVRDLPAAREFYGDVVGLEHVGGDEDVALFGTRPQIVVEAVDPRTNDEGLVGRFTGLSFATDDASALFEELTRACVPAHGEPKRQAWGGIFLHVDDPSGNTITFLQWPPAPTGGQEPP
jgi:catechol 2,3-dioxygenase-like lactoylglutathione lyase family enzyme